MPDQLQAARDEIAALRSELARLKKAAELLSKAVKLLGVAQVRLDIPRYEGLHERIDKLTRDIHANPTASALVEQARKEKA